MKCHFPLSASRYLILLFCIFITPLLKAQTHTPKTITISTHCGGYWEYLPANYNSTSIKYPVIIYIHGGASYGDGSASSLNIMLQNEGLPYYISHNLFPATFPLNGGTTSFIVISPQFSTVPTPQEIKTVIDFVLQTYRVDLMRVYFTGYSAGGDVAWKTPYNLTAANRLAGLVPVAGYNSPYIDTTAQFIAGANLPVWAIHSNSDATIAVAASQNMVNKINSFNPVTPAIITLLNGVTHDSTVLVAYNPQFRPNGKNIYEWFLQYAKNYPPVANAGNDITITLPVNTATLNGSNSSDPENGPLTYSWTKISGPSPYTINDPTLASPVLSNLLAGVYNFKLVVTDNGSLTSSDTMQLTVINPNPNQLPVARAGNDISIQYPQTSVSLSGSASSDPDGVIQTYAWSKISGPSQFTITSPSSVNTTVTSLKPGIYAFQLTVTDNQGGIGLDTVQVTLTNPFPNTLPIANAGPDQTIVLPANSVTLNGSASSDPDGNIVSYQWRQLSGPSTSTINTPNAVSTSAGNLVTAGNYQFELKVTDDSSGIARDTMQVTVNNPPGKPIPGLIEAETYDAMLGVGIYPCTDVGGGQCVGSIDNGDWMDYNVNVASAGTYTVNLRVATPNSGEQFQFRKSGTVIATVPVPLTGGWQNWTTISTTLSLTAGLQTLRIYSTSSGWNLNWMNFSTSSGNQPPVANAGSNQTITLPTSSVSLTGSGVDPDGTIASYAWTNISGPITPAISSPGTASTNVTGLIQQGVYIIRLTVTDNLGATGFSDVTITVNPNSNNANPTITTNNPQTVTTGTASFTSIANTGFPVTSTKWTKFLVPGQTMKRLTVVGSSTSVGYAATSVDSSYVGKLSAYYKTQGIIDTIYNLAVSGSSVFDVNIPFALNLGAPVLLVNYPSNAYTGSTYSVPTICAKYQEIADSCTARGVQFYTTGTQPRNDYSPADRLKLNVINDSLRNRFGTRFIDFLTPVLNPVDNSIQAIYDAGDAIHCNNAGHEVFYQLVRATNIFQNTFSSASVITSPSSANTNVTGLVQGVHKFQVSIVDSRGLAASAVAMVTVNLVNPPNQAPVARAGADQSINLPTTSVTLDGTASTDDHNIVAYQWTKLTGTGGTITTATAATTTFTGLSAGVYTVELKVTDDSSAVGRDTIQITVNAFKPIPGHIEAETYDNMNGVGIYPATDVGGGSCVGSIDNGDWMDYNVFVATSGTYTVNFRVASPNAGAQFQVRKGATVLLTVPVPNTGGWQNWSTVSVSIPLVTGVQTLRIYSTGSGWNFNWVDFISTSAPNQPPVARAGADQTITLPTNSVSLNGTASTDDHNIITYQWTKLTGTGGTLTTPAASITTFTGLSAGVYTIELKVTDDSSAVGRDTIQITVNPNAPNQPPVARAGADQTITLPTNSVSLNGTASTDDHNIVAYQWTKLTGTGGTLTTATASITTFTGLSAGVYTVELKVTDDSSAVGRDTIQITVNPPLNQPPVARAGADQIITLPTSSVSLDGTASTDDHNIVAYQWTKLSGSTGTGGTLTTPNASTTTFTGLSAGIYLVELKVTDDSSAVARDTVQITVNAAASGLVIPGHIEAESYTSMLGVGIYPTTDVGGGSCVGSIDNGDWMNYNVTVTTTGTYSINFRVASPNAGAQFQIRNGSTVLLSVPVPNTGGWQTWTTITVSLPLTAGAQTLRIYSFGSGWNFNWADFTFSGPASNYVPVSEVNQQSPGNADPSLKIFPNPVNDQLTVQLNNAYSGPAKIQVIDQHGVIIKQTQFTKNKGIAQIYLSTTGLSAGTYIIRVQTGSWNKSIKILKL